MEVPWHSFVKQLIIPKAAVKCISKYEKITCYKGYCIFVFFVFLYFTLIEPVPATITKSRDSNNVAKAVPLVFKNLGGYFSIFLFQSRYLRLICNNLSAPHYEQILRSYYSECTQIFVCRCVLCWVLRQKITQCNFSN